MVHCIFSFEKDIGCQRKWQALIFSKCFVFPFMADDSVFFYLTFIICNNYNTYIVLYVLEVVCEKFFIDYGYGGRVAC